MVIIHLLWRGGGVGIYCKLIPDWIKSTWSWLNWIDPIMDIISCPIQSGIQEPNSKYLEKYFNIACSNHPHFVYIIWLRLYPESLVLDYSLDSSTQSPKLPQPESCYGHTYFTKMVVRSFNELDHPVHIIYLSYFLLTLERLYIGLYVIHSLLEDDPVYFIIIPFEIILHPVTFLFIFTIYSSL